MRSWDNISEFYADFARAKDALNSNIGNGMLDLIHRLRNDPDIKPTDLGTAMYSLLIIDGLRIVKIVWVAPDSYNMVFIPDIAMEYEEEYQDTFNKVTVNLNESVAKVKEYLGYLSSKKENRNNE